MGGHFGVEVRIERGGAEVREETERELGWHPKGRDEMVWKKSDARKDYFRGGRAERPKAAAEDAIENSSSRITYPVG
jgi:hypothetical protein